MIDYWLAWWAHQDLNLEPTDYESAALTVELWARKTQSSISTDLRQTSAPQPWLGSPKAESRKPNLVSRRLLRPQPSIRAYQQFVELHLRRWFVTDECAQNRPEKSQRDAQNPGILQREQRFGLDQVPRRSRHGGWIDPHQARADQDEPD